MWERLIPFSLKSRRESDSRRGWRGLLFDLVGGSNRGNYVAVLRGIGRALSQRNQFVLNGVAGERCDIVKIELPHNVRAMVVHRANGNIEASCNFFR